MPIGVVEIRDVKEPDGRGRNRTVKKPFVQGTNREITSNSVRTHGWGAIAFGDLAKGLDIEYEEVGQQNLADVRRYAVVPAGIRRLLDSHGCDHPGLSLDKFVYRSADQSFVKHALQKIVEINNAGGIDAQWFRDLRNRWTAAMIRGDIRPLRCTTTGPLTLHLARASALENAGICLHPLYGFAYLPGSGLKGMARAYAETVWLPAQPDPKLAWRQIEDVFGWAPTPDRRQQINDPNHPATVRRKDDSDPESPEIKASSGNIVFHDAWPESWPKLMVDIVNNHHPDYYKRDDDYPPGDWENPVPVYFLAVQPGVTFTFPLAKRRFEVADELLDLAWQWLLGALCHLGAGAKTAAGYGAFKPADAQAPALPSQSRAVFETTLELVTPAFLAGANQQAEDCDLRPATLRGLLRWWWRTMHAGFVDVKTLRALEAAIWGDTNSGGAVRIVLSPIRFGTKSLYSHPRERNSGVRYVAYGMDEKSKGQRKQRYRLDPPASWNLRLIGRPTQFGVDTDAPKSEQQPASFSAGQVLEQAKAALWLLCNYGGIGSKSRKGFGSLMAGQNKLTDLEHCERIARELRQLCSIDSGFSIDLATSPSISDPGVQRDEIAVQAASPEDVIERLGRAYSAVASRFKHNIDQDGVVHSPNKGAWGLPRKIHGPLDEGPLRRKDGTCIQNPEKWCPPEWLDFPKRPQNISPPNARHASPIHIHVHKASSEEFRVRILAMPAMYLTDRTESVAMLRVFVEAFRANFDASPAHTSTASEGSATPS